jgi:transposase-like protein
MAARRRQKRRHFTEERRSVYLDCLGRTGNHQAAAREAGISAAAARRFRKRTRDYEALCAAAERAADALLAGAESPEEGVADPAFESIRRGADGRLKIQARGRRRWSKTKEERFFAVLRECGNIAASARAAGISREMVWKKRRQWPAFARRFDETMDEAEVALEFRVACLGTHWTEEAEEREHEEAPESEIAPGRFDHEFALRFLKWREEKRRRGSSAPTLSLPPIEEVRDEVLRRIAAIRRHREEQGEQGDAGSSPA